MVEGVGCRGPAPRPREHGPFPLLRQPPLQRIWPETRVRPTFPQQSPPHPPQHEQRMQAHSLGLASGEGGSGFGGNPYQAVEDHLIHRCRNRRGRCGLSDSCRHGLCNGSIIGLLFHGGRHRRRWRGVRWRGGCRRGVEGVAVEE